MVIHLPYSHGFSAYFAGLGRHLAAENSLKDTALGLMVVHGGVTVTTEVAGLGVSAAEGTTSFVGGAVGGRDGVGTEWGVPVGTGVSVHGSITEE